MNRRMVLSMIGKVVLVEAALLLLPLFVSIGYKNDCTAAFLITIAVAVVFGLALSLIFKPKQQGVYAKDGFVIVAFSWLILSAIGALPFVISGEIPSYFDAFFETVSGFTTTGASILDNVEALSEGLLFWRSFTHWIGGMGVLVFVMAIIPANSDRSIHILRAEVPGPTFGKLVPRTADTAKILYLIYVVLTIVEVVLLLFGGMNFFESVVHTFGTAGTGGFGVKCDSIGGYSPYCQWVITIFMVVFGVNFNLYYLLLIKKIKSFFKSSELWFYLAIVAVSTLAITVNIHTRFANAFDALRHSAFQVASIISTTGYSTVDFNTWPGFSKAILLTLMFIGACAGSTAGGFKISRVLVLLKLIKREFRHMLHPRSVGVVKVEGKRVDELTLKGVNAYFAIYVLCFVVVFLLICFEPFGFESNFSAAAACFNNVGPGFGRVGPAASYSHYSDFSKVILSLAMLLGRLEIYPLIVAFLPSTWSKRK